MKKASFNSLNPQQKSEIQDLANLPDEKIETDDIPEVKDWSSGKRGMFYRPVKQEVTLQIDADILEWFKTNQSQEEGYSTIINQALRQYVRQHQHH